MATAHLFWFEMVQNNESMFQSTMLALSLHGQYFHAQTNTNNRLH